MSEPSEQGHEFPDPADIVSQVLVVPGVVVNPGDTLVVACDPYTDADELYRLRAKLVAHMPGVTVLVLAGGVHLAAVKGTGLDVPARPLVELPEDGGVTRMRVTNPPGDGTQHTVSVQAEFDRHEYERATVGLDLNAPGDAPIPGGRSTDAPAF